jgi:CubicO group peptidase (beta-lactamase class C family)
MSLTAVVLALSLSMLEPASERDGVTEQRARAADALFERWDDNDSPGCSLAVIQDGTIVHSGAYGMANLDHDIPITTTTMFHVASVSKQFTAAAIVLLAQDGKLSLGADIHEYLPELPDFGATITLRHLIHHTSGLRDQWDLLGLSGWRYSRDLITDEDVMSLVERQRELNFPPGEMHLYSNTGYTLLAQIVEKVSGKSLREFTRERIFVPLDMHRTFFRDDFSEIVKGQAYGYVPSGDTFRLSVTNFDTVGATSLMTNVEEMVRWDRNFDDPEVGGEALVEQMLERGTLNDGEEISYAFGLSRGEYRGVPIVEHAGGDAGYRAHFIRFPEQRFSVVCLCNGAIPSGTLARRVADIWLEDELEPPPQAVTAAEALEPVVLDDNSLVRKVGLYWNRDRDRHVVLELQDGKLLARVEGNVFELIPVTKNRFNLVDAPIVLLFDSETKPPRFTALGDGDEQRVYERVEAADPEIRQLAGYVGKYVSEEIPIPYHLALEDGALVLRRLKSPPETLEPTELDTFRGPIGTVRFARDADGTITGFALSTGRIRNLRFGKQ